MSKHDIRSSKNPISEVLPLQVRGQKDFTLRGLWRVVIENSCRIRSISRETEFYCLYFPNKSNYKFKNAIPSPFVSAKAGRKFGESRKCLKLVNLCTPKFEERKFEDGIQIRESPAFPQAHQLLSLRPSDHSILSGPRTDLEGASVFDKFSPRPILQLYKITFCA